MEHQRTDSIFGRVDTDDIAAKLQLIERARADAVKEYPPSSQTEIQGTESAIVSHIGRERREAVKSCHGLLRSLSDQRRNIDPTAVKLQLLNIPGDCEIAIDRLNARHQAKLTSLTDKVRKQKKNYDLFRQKNNLHRIAQYPSSKILHFSIIATIVILETLANAYFFQRGSELGYLGGLQQAFIFSLVNVLLAIFVGDNLFRQTNHVQFSRRVWGWLSLGGYLIVLLLFNLLIGHYRAALQRTVLENLDPLIAFQLAYESFIAGPFAIPDVEAWILVIMGVLVGLIAFVKAYKADDPYPGYGDVQRNYDALKQELDEQVSEMQGSVTKAIDKAREETRALPADLKKQHRVLQSLLQTADAVPERLKLHLQDLQDACNELLRRYRDENLKIRQTSAPSYFMSSFEFPEESFAGDISLAQEQEYANRIEKEIDGLGTHIEEIRTRLRELNRSALQRIADHTV